MSTFEVPMLAIRVTDQSPEWLTGHKDLYEGLVVRHPQEVQMIVLTDRDGMIGLELHQSIWDGLCSDALGLLPGSVRTLGAAEGDRLSVWADQCENPQGQRASLCRAVVQLLRFAPGGVLAVQRQLAGEPRGFWERVG